MSCGCVCWCYRSLHWNTEVCNVDVCVGVTGRCIGTLKGHEDEVLDVAFDYTGQHLLTASADATARCYNAVNHNLITKFEGHEGEISKVGLGHSWCCCQFTWPYLSLTAFLFLPCHL